MIGALKIKISISILINFIRIYGTVQFDSVLLFSNIQDQDAYLKKIIDQISNS